MPKKILVTGATGQIGSELTTELRRRYGGDSVVAAGHSRHPSRALAKGGPFEYVDTLDQKVMERVVVRYDVDTVYHLAAVLSATGEKDPTAAWRVNVEGLRNILAIASGRPTMILFWPSSVAVFGPDSPRTFTPQSTIMIPRTMYGVTKLAGELLCNYYNLRYNVDVRSIRYPGIIGSETLPGGGTTDYAVEIFFEALTKKRYTCFLRPDTTLPMMYMPDCVDGTIALMEADSSRVGWHMGYNLAAMSFSPAALVSEIQKHIPDFRCRYRPDFRQRIADSWPTSIDDTQARTDWGWSPKYNLSSMTEDMIARVSARLKLRSKRKGLR